MTTEGPVRATTTPPPEPPDVPAELDLSRRRPRRRPPAQSEIRGINTIASLPEQSGPGRGGDRDDGAADGRRRGVRDEGQGGRRDG